MSNIPLSPTAYRTLKVQTAAGIYSGWISNNDSPQVSVCLQIASVILTEAGLVEVPEETINIDLEYCRCHKVGTCPLHTNPTTPTPASSAEGERCKYVMGGTGRGQTNWYCGNLNPCPLHPSV